jgi:hypothetical protein
MKVYEVEYRAVVTVVEQDMGKAALQGAALIKRESASNFCESHSRKRF